MEEAAFRKYTESLQPLVRHISAKTLKLRIMETYEKAKLKLKEMFENNDEKEELDAKPGKLSFTTDGWTSENHKAVIAVTASWFNGRFELIDVIISFREVGVSHSGENICKSFLQVIEEYGMEEKVRKKSSLIILFTIYFADNAFFLFFPAALHHNW